MRLPRPQVIEEDGRPAYAVVPWAEWQRLAEALEDLALAEIADQVRADLAAGRELLLPEEVALRIADGGNRVRAVREWRGLTQAALAGRAGLRQSYLSGIEAGRKRPTVATLKALARALEVPVALLIEP